jgi:hypothetical protein
VITGRFLPMVRAIFHLAATTVGGFFAALLLFVGYVTGASFLLMAALKPIFPNNVGFYSVNGPGSFPTSLQVKFPAEGLPSGGNWVILIGLVCGLALLVLTHRGARKFLAWIRERRSRGVFPRP